jgi:hypothetical protein
MFSFFAFPSLNPSFLHFSLYIFVHSICMFASSFVYLFTFVKNMKAEPLKAFLMFAFLDLWTEVFFTKCQTSYILLHSNLQYQSLCFLLLQV